MKVSEIAESIIKTADKEKSKQLTTLKVICNSDSAFVAAVKKYESYEKLMKKAFLLSRTWQKLGQARTWKITLKALAAALKSLASSFKRLTEVNELPALIQTQVQKLLKFSDFQMQLSL